MKWITGVLKGLLCGVLICAVSLSAGAQSTGGGQRRDGPPYTHDGMPRPKTDPPKNHGNGNDNWILAIVGIAVAAIAVKHFLDTQPKPEQLAKDGPQFDDAYNMSHFAVHGFVKGGWPMLVEYQPQPGSRVWVEVSAPGRRTFTRELAADTAERRLAIFKLPDDLGEEPQVGSFVVHAVRNAPRAGSFLDDVRPPAQDEPAQLRIFAIGAGPRAVGSVAIDQVQFGPSNIKVTLSDVALYSFHSRSNFDRVAVDVGRVGRKDGIIGVERVKSEVMETGIGKDQWIGRELPRKSWNGRDGRGVVSRGEHLLMVRAWLGSVKEGDWVAAQSDATVAVE